MENQQADQRRLIETWDIFLRQEILQIFRILKWVQRVRAQDTAAEDAASFYPYPEPCMLSPTWSTVVIAKMIPLPMIYNRSWFTIVLLEIYEVAERLELCQPSVMRSINVANVRQWADFTEYCVAFHRSQTYISGSSCKFWQEGKPLCYSLMGWNATLSISLTISPFFGFLT